ncbi:MAG: PilZ domain-containing protein [Kiloniellales bacterium]|nr:PilZ domain-containing protein [Kiloniellales bacterium]
MIKARRPSPDVRRRFRRIPVLWPARLGQADDGECAILNVSGAGAKLRLTDPRPYGGVVSLSSPRFGTLRGRVVWRKDAYLGLAFTDPPAQVANVLVPALP